MEYDEAQIPTKELLKKRRQQAYRLAKAEAKKERQQAKQEALAAKEQERAERDEALWKLLKKGNKLKPEEA